MIKSIMADFRFIKVYSFDIIDISVVITFHNKDDMLLCIDPGRDMEGCIDCYIHDGYGNVFTTDNKLLRYKIDGSD